MATRYTGTPGLPQLMAIDYYGRNQARELEVWKSINLSTKVISVENCERTIVLGLEKDFEDFPRSLDYKEFRTYKGEQAYAHVLSFMLGVLNPKGYDAPAAERFYKNWAKINQQNPAKAKVFADVVAALNVDYNTIRKNICAGIKPERGWLVARDLSAHKHGDSVLIIGDIDEEEEATVLTQNIAATMNGNNAAKASSLDITHPDPVTARVLVKQIEAQFASKKIDINLAVCDFARDLPFAFEMADHVYITLKMGKYPQADQFIRECWKKRQREDNTMVHMRDSKQNTGLSSAWNRLDHFISPDDLRRESQLRERQFMHLMCAARNAAHACARLRITEDHAQPSSIMDDRFLEFLPA